MKHDNIFLFSMVSLIHREMETAAQQAVPQTNHIHTAQNSSKSKSAHKTDREGAQGEGVRLAHGEEGMYGLEIHGKSVQSTPQERAERRSPDSLSAHKDQHPTVVQVVLPPEQNGNVVYQRGLVSRKDSEKHVQRKTTLAQVEQWVKVHKGDPTKRSVL